DHPVCTHELVVPGVHDGGAQDAFCSSLAEIDGAVVDEHVDAELDAPGDLVVRAVEVVVGHPDVVQPLLGGGSGAAGPVARHVNPVALCAPGRHRLHRTGVGLGRQDVLVGVRLLHA